jgi:hypothetical protein
MKRMKIACTVLLCLLFTAFMYAQQDEPKPREASPQERPEQKPEGPEKDNAKQDNAKQDKANTDKNVNEEKQAEQEKQKQSDKQMEKEKSSDKNAGARDMNNGRPTGKSARIPDDKFRSNFGREHHFSIGRPTMVNNRPGFVYGGYSFVIVDPWPVGWAYTDETYVDFIDGEYFLFDVLHPGVRIALFVSL